MGDRASAGWSRRAVLRAALLGGAAAVVPRRRVLAGLPGAPAKPCTPQRPRAQWGVYRAGAPGNMAEIEQLAAQAGAAPASVLWYEAWTSRYASPPALAAECGRVLAAGFRPMLTWMTLEQMARTVPLGSSNAEIAAGSKDRYVEACARVLAALAAPVVLRLDHEMNGSWSPWSPGRATASGAANSASSFVAMWRRVHAIFRSNGASQVSFCWSPNVLYTGGPPLAPLYPGNRFVDLLAMDGFNRGGEPWTSPLELFGRTYAELVALAPGKPVVVAETGSVAARGRPGAGRRQWIEQFPEALAAMPAIESVTWFDAGAYALSRGDLGAVAAVFG